MKWEQIITESLYQSGMLRLFQRVSQSYERSKKTPGAFPRLRHVSTSKFVILCYHRVGEGGVPIYSQLPPETFRAQMEFLRRRYRIISLEELCREIANPQPIGQAVAITFDDGYQDLYRYAFPVLQRLHIPATIYLTIGAVETGQVAWYDRVFLALQIFPAQHLHLELDQLQHFDLTDASTRFQAALDIVSCLRRLPDARRRQCCAELEAKVQLPPEELAGRMLNWEQVQSMHRAGIAFGSHTISHPVISRLSLAEVERELVGSKRILEERIQTKVEDFAYPFGQPADCSSSATDILVRSGYRSATTTVWGVNSRGTNAFALRRVQIGEERSLATFAYRLNQLFMEGPCESPEFGPSEVMKQGDVAMRTSSQLDG